ncbi:TPA: arylsulfatase [Clostridium perfringens]|uniref:arylsulfatase n=1 Tax=Clostridium perfringens TaxID=1502 RepID=UPI001159C9BE|nr:arylsulfatase [Clostridium perfringens]EHK2364545.1 arylsulfatase [Clostridium perfringens]EJT5928341.1 arylsulfatase [Clostridium perfringens]EJT6483062.1 arylsulfatase [Clostridium perfringens]MDU2325233.1 arylsulfatase [Clostridium perfringens]MDU7108018.1 arylsulfatase [Clostridium perfringens]
MKPNIVLIMVDQMRGDCLGVNGNEFIETPNLDMMATEGYNFENAYTAVPSCIASRTSILTGMSQKSHGRVGYEDGVSWNYKNTIASEFSKAGYHTQCIGKMHVYPERNLCGFHNIMLHDGYLHFARNKEGKASTQIEQCDDYLKWFREKKGHNVDLIDIGLDCNSWVSRPWGYEENLHPTNWVVNESIDFLRRRDPSKPFFLNMSFVRPHSPLDPPKFYFDMYKDEELPEHLMGDWANKEDEENRGKDINCVKGIINKKTLKRAKAAYYGSITHIDHQIGRFLIALSEYGELNNTIFLFVSDHGDMMGDHNWFRKGIPYEGSTRVPFFIYDPGNLLKGKKGKVFDEVLELRDIMPTLLDFAHISIPDSVEGLSLKDLIEERNSTWREYIHGEHSFGEDSNHYIVTKRDKFLWFSQRGEEQYFDLEKDPKELTNLINSEEYKDRIDYLRKILIKELEGREEGYTDGNKLLKGYPVSTLKHIR